MLESTFAVGINDFLANDSQWNTDYQSGCGQCDFWRLRDSYDEDNGVHCDSHFIDNTYLLVRFKLLRLALADDRNGRSFRYCSTR